MEFDELDIRLAIRHPEKGKRCFHVIEPDHPIQRRPFQCSFPLQFKPEVEKERFRGRKIVDDDTHMIDAMVEFPRYHGQIVPTPQ